MYKSPITIIESTIDAFSKTIIEQRDNAIFAKIQDSFGVDLDKHELLRALQYDRDQYAKGYADGKADAMAELVRCKDCFANGCCSVQIDLDMGEDGYCAKGRKENR